jgi:putative mycofactocin binding protein MftB
MTLVLEEAYDLDPQVALRPEPFGALAYHYGNRRLNHMRVPELVELVESHDRFPCAAAAFDAAGIDPRRWPSFEKALTSLAAGEFLVSDLTEGPT